MLKINKIWKRSTNYNGLYVSCWDLYFLNNFIRKHITFRDWYKYTVLIFFRTWELGPHQFLLPASVFTHHWQKKKNMPFFFKILHHFFDEKYIIPISLTNFTSTACITCFLNACYIWDVPVVDIYNIIDIISVQAIKLPDFLNFRVCLL